jgi:hypothetical protein
VSSLVSKKTISKPINLKVNPDKYLYEDMVADLIKISDNNPGVELNTIGKSSGTLFNSSRDSIYYYDKISVDKRELYALDICPTKKKKGQIFIVAGHPLFK